MKKKIVIIILVINTACYASASISDRPLKNDTLTSPPGTDFLSEHTEGQWFLGFRVIDNHGETMNQFTLKRGYITFKHGFSEKLSVRFTQDITLDQEGMDKGNVEMRLKYCYLNQKMNDFLIFTDPAFEFGLVHRPWIDFEEKINLFRVQGTMFLERIHMMNSADFGATFSSLIGGKLDDGYLDAVNSKVPGKFGSFSIGIYNGGGYHALEFNKNKTVEGRITLRPFPGTLPGFQISYNTIYGKGNTSSNPDFVLNSCFLSYERKHLTITSQYYDARGNSSGSFSDSLGNAYGNSGYSIFGRIQIPQTKWSFFGRYDVFHNAELSISDSNCYIAGIAYNFFQENKLVLDVDYFEGINNSDLKNVIYEAAIEIHF
jgi:hypothetical protein